MFAPIVAVEALLRTAGALPVNVKFLLEGQEEIGSPQLAGFVSSHRELLACDFALSADGDQWSETVPTLLTSLRGICALQVDVTGPAADMHSGLYGGTIQNPLHALAELIAGLHDADGRVAVNGFYDDVVEPTPEQRARYARVPFDEAAYLATTGVPALYGEAGWSTYEREWIRPTLEVNGLWGGFQGDGTKTVLPAAAHAKITCRLVANQQPARILNLVADAPAPPRPRRGARELRRQRRARRALLGPGRPSRQPGGGQGAGATVRGSAPAHRLRRQHSGVRLVAGRAGHPHHRLLLRSRRRGRARPGRVLSPGQLWARTGGVLSYPARVGRGMSGPGQSVTRHTANIDVPAAPVGRHGRFRGLAAAMPAVLALLLATAGCTVNQQLTLRVDRSGDAQIHVKLEPVFVDYLDTLAEAAGDSEILPEAVFDTEEVERSIGERRGATVTHVATPTPEELALSLTFEDLKALLARNAPVPGPASTRRSSPFPAAARARCGYISPATTTANSPPCFRYSITHCWSASARSRIWR